MVDFYYSFIIKVYLLSGMLALYQSKSNIKMKITRALTLVPMEIKQW